MQNLAFENVWNDSSCHEEVISYWKELNVLPSGLDPNERAKQLLYTARSEEKIVGVTTVHDIVVKNLNNKPFFNFRVLLHPDYRMPGLVDKLCVLSRDFLEGLYLEGNSANIGMITLAENQSLVTHRNEAVWPSSGFTYIGKSKAGFPIRILYFKGAEI